MYLQMPSFVMLAVLSAGAMSRCDARDDVTVGHTPAELDLRECFGEATACAPSGVQQTQLVVPELGSCEASEARTVTLAWQVELPTGGYRGGEGASDQFSVARDGSVWVAGPAGHGAFVARYDAEGHELGRADVKFDRLLPDFYETRALMLAVDSDGRPHVGYTVILASESRGWREESQYWLGHYAADAEALGEPIRIKGLTPDWPLQLVAGADASLRVAGTGEEQPWVMARLEPDGSPGWIQTAVRQIGPSDLVGDALGQTALLGLDPGPTADIATTSLAMYDQFGNLLWDLEPPSGPGRLVAGPGNDLLWSSSMAFEVSDPVDPLNALLNDAVLYRISSDGRVLWATRLVGRIDPVMLSGTGRGIVQPALDGTGRIFLATDAHEIYTLNADGDGCSRLELMVSDPAWAIVDTGVTTDGTLFVLLWHPGGRWSVARVQL